MQFPPGHPFYQPRKPDNFSRRNLLMVLGCLGTAGLCGWSGLLGGLLLLTDDDDAAVPVPPAGVGDITASPPARAQTQVEPPLMIPRSGWGALPPDHTARNERDFYSLDNPEGWRVYDVPLTEAYQTVVIHHSVIDEGDDVSTLLEIQRAHRQDRGWADVGYHYFVGKDGIPYEGRDVHVRGVHVEGYNTGSVGVCLLGNLMLESPGEAQIRAASRLVAWLSIYLALTHLAGHREFNDSTQCPGDFLMPFLDEMAAGAGLLRGIEGYIAPPEQTESSRNACPCCLVTL